MIVWGADQQIIPWVEAQLGVTFGHATSVGFALRDEGLVAGVVYHNWMPQYGSIEASMASTTPRWATKEAIRFMFWVPFANIGAQRIYTTIGKKNRRAIRFNRKLGLVYEGKGRRALGDDDAVIYSMLIEEWRDSKWYVDLEADDGQGLGQSAAG